MIKPQDLRIGDIIQKYNGIPCRVTSTFVKGPEILHNIQEAKGGCIAVVYLDNNQCDDGLPSLFNPIPLTAEILEKNGWEKKKDGWYIKPLGENDFLSVEFGYDDGVRVFLKRAVNNHYAKLNTANYVHQLQHILWVLGLNAELELKR